MSEIITVGAELIVPNTVLAQRYEIERLIGSGGMACVYMVHDRIENRHVALKLLHAAYAKDRNYVDRFIQEAQLMRKVDHPNVVRTFDIAHDEGRLFFTMEYVAGYTLRDLIDAGGNDLVAIQRTLKGICSGLDAIHRNDIVHRDLKPSNILVDALGRVRIADFGIARPADSRLTGINEKLGCLEYMAPEIFEGKEITPAADFYSLGILLYELTTGEPPFTNVHMAKLIDLHVRGQHQSIRKANPDFPEWLEALVDGLLEKVPAKRIASTREVLAFFPVSAPGGDRYENPAVLSDGISSPTRRPSSKIYKVSATKILRTDHVTRKRKPTATISISLPKDAAVVFELEPPSRDVIYFGVFLASLQVLDGVLTSEGMDRYGTRAEGNPMLRNLMDTLTPDQALFLVKGFAILIVICLTIMAKRSKVVQDLIGALSCIYLFTAIIPWVYVLWFR